MRRCSAFLLAIVMVFATLFSDIGTTTAYAAFYDTVTVNFLYEFRDSRGAKTAERYATETASITVNSSLSESVRINAPAVPTGYSFQNVTIEKQTCSPKYDANDKFVHTEFVNEKKKIELAFQGTGTAEGSSQRTVTLRIICTANPYEITYDYNGGMGEVAGKQVYYGENYGTLATGKRAGYSLVGWSTDIAGTKYVYADTKVTKAEKHVLYAQWSANPYTVTYNACGGACEIASVQVSYGGSYPLPSATKAGYIFAGWFTESEGGAQITNETVMSRNQDHTVYAHWTNDSYTVSFDGNGGIASSVNKKVTYMGVYGTLPTAERVGYTFDGWWTEKTEGSQITASSTMSVAGKQTLYAHWKPNVYEITLDANGGKDLEIKKLNVIYDAAYGTLPIPEREGYTFTGWYLGKERIEEDSLVEITKNEVLKASWHPNSYEIVFEAEPGVCDTKSKIVTYGETYGSLPDAHRVGYTFSGWHLGKQKIVAETTVSITDDDVLIAKWTPNVYAVTFHANGGTCTAKQWYYTYDDIYGEMPMPEREGYRFLGWWTAKEGGEQITKEMEVTVTADFDLYARWEKIPEEKTDEDYFYPASDDTGAYDKDKGKTLQEVAKESGYAKNQLRNIMNLYQVKAEVAADIMTRATKLGASYKVIVTEPESIERKKSGSDVSGSKFSPLKAKVGKTTGSAITVKWSKVKGAAGYVIYGSACGNNYFKLGTTTGAGSFTHKKLKKQTYYRYIVLAYANIDGKQVPIAISKNVHGVTKGDANLENDKTYGNASKITVKNEKKLKQAIKAGKKIQIKTKVTYLAGKHTTHRKIAYESSNEVVATVSSTGVIKAKKKGSCYIYVYTQNGLSKKIKIKVK